MSRFSGIFGKMSLLLFLPGYGLSRVLPRVHVHNLIAYRWTRYLAVYLTYTLGHFVRLGNYSAVIEMCYYHFFFLNFIFWDIFVISTTSITCRVVTITVDTFRWRIVRFLAKAIMMVTCAYYAPRWYMAKFFHVWEALAVCALRDVFWWSSWFNNYYTV